MPDSSVSDLAARRGWASTAADFVAADTATVMESLEAFVPDASPQQRRAWRDSVAALRRALKDAAARDAAASGWGVVLEYELPMEARRVDAALLLGGAVAVLEFKGKAQPSDADLDQAHAYARDLRCYHAACDGRTVRPVLVAMRAAGEHGRERGVHVCGPDALAQALAATAEASGRPLPLEELLDAAAYRPLPTLVAAARELFRTHELRWVPRAAAETDAAAGAVSRVVHEAARTSTRRLVLLTGVPGAGKTLVGLRTVHAHFLDDLAPAREGGGRHTAPAVFLSGNGPLVEVLQYELRDAGGGGRAFVRGVKDYVARYDRDPRLVPPEHVLVFDEAQRAYDAAMVAEKHRLAPSQARSEPEHFVSFACRVPEWCVVLGLIGGGQEIHKGEEAGLGRWAEAIRRGPERAAWTVHGPEAVADVFAGLPFESDPALSLDLSLRSHLAFGLHRFVGRLLESEPTPAAELARLATALTGQGHDLRLTRDLESARAYLRERYAGDRRARFGLLASSRDRELVRFGVANDFQATSRVRFGPWYGDDEDAPGGRSCRHLRECVTEFGAQGLELDAVLVAWGTDFAVTADGTWSVERMARYQRRGAPVREPWTLRANAYRVLLTRARDATVVFVPPLAELDRTHGRLLSVGFRPLMGV